MDCEDRLKPSAFALPPFPLQDVANALHGITLQPFGVSDTQRGRQQKTREQGRGKRNVPGRKDGDMVSQALTL